MIYYKSIVGYYAFPIFIITVRGYITLRNVLPRYTDDGFVDGCINAVLCILIMFAVFAAVLTAIAPRGEDGASKIFGYELRLVESDSMEGHPDVDVSDYKIKSFSKDTLIALERVPEGIRESYDWYSTVKVGDVLTVRYTYNRQVTITHRVIDVEKKEDGSGFIIRLQGDNLNSDASLLTQEIDTSNTNSTNYVIGRVVWTSYFAGVLIGGGQRVFKDFAGE